MRLWTLHPKYLDPSGLVAAWRESLLAQKVLIGHTKGYSNHPQLIRFQIQPDPIKAIGAFLIEIASNADSRGYNFNKRKILYHHSIEPITETNGQLIYEWNHLKAKLRVRSPNLYERLIKTITPESHPLFRIIPGEIKPWEKTKHGAATNP